MQKERPILFSGAMVRAILDGRKTQTRRILKSKGYKIDIDTSNKTGLLDCVIEDEYGDYYPYRPYGDVGDLLWVRESWAARPDMDHLPPSQCDDTGIWWKASVSAFSTGYEACHGKWRPSIFMPRWASRITLEIVIVRVEQLQTISEKDAISEGMGKCCDAPDHGPIVAYHGLWDMINGPGSWDSNPWVWVIEFKVIKK